MSNHRSYYRDYSRQMYKTYKIYNKTFYPTVYIIEASDENEKFYKIGCTSQNVNRRLSSFPYNFKLLAEIDDWKVKYKKIDSLEGFLQEYHKNYWYVPNKKFGGYMECYSQIDFDFINKKFKNLCLV